MAVKNIRRISFDRGMYGLEEIIRLIYFDKTSPVFGITLCIIMDFLRKYSSSISKIGYTDNNSIRVYLKIDPKELESREIIFLNKISS